MLLLPFPRRCDAVASLPLRQADNGDNVSTQKQSLAATIALTVCHSTCPAAPHSILDRLLASLANWPNEGGSQIAQQKWNFWSSDYSERNAERVSSEDSIFTEGI